MKELVQKVLDRCGYSHLEPTEDNLVECFLDYVDGGVFGNLTVDEAREDIDSGDISLKMICHNLLNVR